MTEKKAEPELSADLPLEERQRRAREAQREIREGIRDRYIEKRQDICAADRRG